MRLSFTSGTLEKQGTDILAARFAHVHRLWYIPHPFSTPWMGAAPVAVCKRHLCVCGVVWACRPLPSLRCVGLQVEEKRARSMLRVSYEEMQFRHMILGVEGRIHTALHVQHQQQVGHAQIQWERDCAVEVDWLQLREGQEREGVRHGAGLAGDTLRLLSEEMLWRRRTEASWAGQHARMRCEWEELGGRGGVWKACAHEMRELQGRRGLCCAEMAGRRWLQETEVRLHEKSRTLMDVDPEEQKSRDNLRREQSLVWQEHSGWVATLAELNGLWNAERQDRAQAHVAWGLFLQALGPLHEELTARHVLLLQHDAALAVLHALHEELQERLVLSEKSRHAQWVHSHLLEMLHVEKGRRIEEVAAFVALEQQQRLQLQSAAAFPIEVQMMEWRGRWQVCPCPCPCPCPCHCSCRGPSSLRPKALPCPALAIAVAVALPPAASSAWSLVLPLNYRCYRRSSPQSKSLPRRPRASGLSTKQIWPTVLTWRNMDIYGGWKARSSKRGLH